MDTRSYEEATLELALNDLAPMDGSEPRADVLEFWLRELYRLDETCQRHSSGCDLAMNIREIILDVLSETQELVEISYMRHTYHSEYGDMEILTFGYWILEEPRIEMWSQEPDHLGYEITIAGLISRTPWSYDSDGLALVTTLRVWRDPESLTPDQTQQYIRRAIEDNVWRFEDLDTLHREDEF